MAFTFTTTLRFTMQGVGDSNNTWGLYLNSGVIQLIDDAIGGFLAVAITTDTTLSTANGVTDQARYKSLKFTGTLVLASTITLPSVGKTYKIWNATNKTLTFTTGAGNTVLVDSGDITDIWTDGSNVKTTTFGGLDLKSYIAASVLAVVGSLPAVAGNAGKYVYTDGTSTFYRQPATTDFSDYQSAIVGVQVALAVAL